MQHVGDAACACPCKHHNREGENALVSLQHQKQTGNSKLGLSSCRESHRQKGGISQGVSCGRRFENLRRSVSYTGTRLSACLLDDQGSLEVTLLNQLVVTTNVTTGTGRKEGRKKGRKEGRKNEEGVCQPGLRDSMTSKPSACGTAPPAVEIVDGGTKEKLRTLVCGRRLASLRLNLIWFAAEGLLVCG